MSFEEQSQLAHVLDVMTRYLSRMTMHPRWRDAPMVYKNLIPLLSDAEDKIWRAKQILQHQKEYYYENIDKEVI